MDDMLHLAVLAALGIVLCSFIVVNADVTGSVMADSNVYKVRGGNVYQEIAIVGGRELPQYRPSPVDWNFAPTEDLFEAVAERSYFAWSKGGITQAQYQTILDALMALQLGIEERCVSEQDVKVALRLFGGANKHDQFREQYAKAAACLKEKRDKEEPQVSRPAPSMPPVGPTVFEGDWTLVMGGINGTFSVDGFNATLKISDYFYSGPIEVVEDGLNFFRNGLGMELKRQDGSFSGYLFADGGNFSVSMVR